MLLLKMVSDSVGLLSPEDRLEQQLWPRRGVMVVILSARVKQRCTVCMKALWAKAVWWVNCCYRVGIVHSEKLSFDGKLVDAGATLSFVNLAIFRDKIGC